MSIDFSLLNFNNLKVKFNITRNLILKHIFTFLKCITIQSPIKSCPLCGIIQAENGRRKK